MVFWANVYIDDKGRQWLGVRSPSRFISSLNSSTLARHGIKTLYRLKIKWKET